jgi:hypothetical protein
MLATGCVCVSVAAVLMVPRMRSLREDRRGNLHGWPELDEPARPNGESAIARKRHRRLTGVDGPKSAGSRAQSPNES